MKPSYSNKNNYFPQGGLLLFLRLLLIGVGVGVVTGTALSIISNDNKASNNNSFFNLEKILLPKLKKDSSPNLTNNLEENHLLTSKWQELSKSNKDIKISAYVLHDNGTYSGINIDQQMPASNSIKVPILLILLHLVDEGIIEWNEPLILTKDVINGGSGWLRYQELGSIYSVHEIANQMISISDDTATNLIIKRIGGPDNVNKYLLKLNLKDTTVNSLLPDKYGENKTTTRDIVKALTLSRSDKLLKQNTKDIFRDILNSSITNNLIPDGALIGLNQKMDNSDSKLQDKGYKILNASGYSSISNTDSAIIRFPDTSLAFTSFIAIGRSDDKQSSKLIRLMVSEMIQVLKPKSYSKEESIKAVEN